MHALIFEIVLRTGHFRRAVIANLRATAYSAIGMPALNALAQPWLTTEHGSTTEVCQAARHNWLGIPTFRVQQSFANTRTQSHVEMCDALYAMMWQLTEM